MLDDLNFNTTINNHHHHQQQQHILSDKQSSFMSSTTAYLNYPENRPFINTKWVRSTNATTSKAFPESNRDCNF